MLTTAVQQSVKVDTDEFIGLEKYTCTCYGDSKDKNIYYLVPECPTFVGDNGKPKFTFYKYRSTDQQGGYAMFTVMLPQPTPKLTDKIKAELYGGITSQLEAKSKLIVNMVKAKQALDADPENTQKQQAYNDDLKLTGLNTEEANKYIGLYDSSKGNDQFLSELLPKDAQAIKIKTPDYRSAKASLIIDDNKSFYRQIPTELHPSGMGDNNTVFSLSLTGEGATLFENVLKGTDDNSSIGIKFEFGLDSSLPAAKVTVKYNSDKTKEVTKTVTRHTWSADEKKISQKYYEDEAVSVDVETGLTAAEMGMTQEQYIAWKQGLTDWGQKQIEQILSSQTGLDMSLDLLNDAGGFDKFKESLDETKSFTRVYEENSVVAFSLFPQSQLPSIESIVGKANVGEYFKEYDLNDPFYQYIQPTFFVAGDLTKYDISNIAVTAKYDANNTQTLIFDKDTPSNQSTDKWFIDDKIGRVFSYSYTVSFTGAKAKNFHSGEILVKDEIVQTINVANCGVVYEDISMLFGAQSWEDFSQVVIKTQYSDPSKEINVKVDTQSITEGVKPRPFIYPIGIAQEEPVYYTAEYYTKDGNNFTFIPSSANTNSQMPGYAATRSQQIQIVDALPKSKTYQIIFLPAKPADLRLITFEMEVNYAKYHFKQTKNFAITKDFDGDLMKELTFDFMDESESDDVAVTYKASIYYTNGEKTNIDQVADSDFVIINC